MSNIDLRNMDCMELLAGLPDKSVSLAIVDPPYGINVNMNIGVRKGKGKKHKTKDWDNSAPTKEYFDELFRVSKNQIIWGGNNYELPPSQYFCIWDKGETMYQRDFAEAEYAWVSSGGTRIFKKSPNQTNRIHPTQKPVALYKWLLKNYAKEGDTILDTHIGSGSIAIACYDMGFDLLGCELDKEYFDAMVKRFETHKLQQKLL